MAHRPAAPTMEPSHITEFASPRYFDKLRSLNETTANVSTGASTTTTTTSHTHPVPAATRSSLESEHEQHGSHTFTLPLGHGRRPGMLAQRKSDENVRPSEPKKRTFAHDLGLRRPSFNAVAKVGSKVPLRAPFLSSSHTDEGIARRSLSETSSLYDLFHNLPNELQLQIIAPLPLTDILNLRLTCRSFAHLIALNEAPIARHHITESIPAYARRLYPIANPGDVNLRHVYGIWHRLHVAWKLTQLIAEQTTKEIFLRTTDAQRAEFEPQHMRMRQHLMPLIFTIFHFFEHTRELHAQYLATHGVPLRLTPYTINPIERQVMDMYDDETLLRTHEIFPLVMASFSRRLRPPSYIGRLERSIKGYLKDKPADEVYTTILAVGGLRQAEKFWDTKGYNARRAAVDHWYGSVMKAPVELPAKSKLSLLPSFGRKKHTAPTDAPISDSCNETGNCGDWFCVRCSCPDYRKRRSGDAALLNSSLSIGPPMGPLPQKQLRLLLTDLPHLSDIWLPTGEAVILERRIVDSPTRIKRNSQVLLDLIKEEGLPQEDWSPANELVIERTLSHNSRMDSFGGV